MATVYNKPFGERKKEAPLFGRSFGQTMIASTGLCQNAFVPKGLRETFSNDFRDDTAGGRQCVCVARGVLLDRPPAARLKTLGDSTKLLFVISWNQARGIMNRIRPSPPSPGSARSGQGFFLLLGVEPGLDFIFWEGTMDR